MYVLETGRRRSSPKNSDASLRTLTFEACLRRLSAVGADSRPNTSLCNFFHLCLYAWMKKFMKNLKTALLNTDGIYGLKQDVKQFQIRRTLVGARPLAEVSYPMYTTLPRRSSTITLSCCLLDDRLPSICARYLGVLSKQLMVDGSTRFALDLPVDHRTSKSRLPLLFVKRQRLQTTIENCVAVRNLSVC